MDFECIDNQLIPLHSFKDLFSLKNENILIYFPHGLGDWVMYNSITPFIKNKIYMTRIGDNYTSILNDSSVFPIYSGINNVHHEQSDKIDKKIYTSIPKNILTYCQENAIKYFYYEKFYEHGANFPYNSKPRNILNQVQNLLSELEKNNLNSVLKNNINVSDNPFTTNILLSKLYSHTNYSNNKKLIVISRYGITSAGKNWGHLHRCEKYKNEADEAREFIGLCLQKNKNCVFISMENTKLFEPHSLKNHNKNVYTFEELFGSFDNEYSIPYAMLLKSLFTVCDAHISCPTGPLGLSLLYNNVKTIGLYIELMPSWYFEPGNNNINIISNSNIHSRKNDNRTFDGMSNVQYVNKYVNTDYISGQDVFNCIEDIL